MDALGYIPNAAARSLSTAKSHAIGVVLPDLHGEFFGEVVRGMDKAASERGYLLLLSTMHADSRLAHQAMGTMRSEEHTSELQSLMRISYAVFCLTKKKPQ